MYQHWVTEDGSHHWRLRSPGNHVVLLFGTSRKTLRAVKRSIEKLRRWCKEPEVPLRSIGYNHAERVEGLRHHFTIWDGDDILGVSSEYMHVRSLKNGAQLVREFGRTADVEEIEDPYAQA